MSVAYAYPSKRIGSSHPAQILGRVLVLLMAFGTGQEAWSRDIDASRISFMERVSFFAHVGPFNHRLASGVLQSITMCQ